MLRHIACFRWREGTTDAQVELLAELLAALPAAIPEIRRYHFGRDARLAAGNFDFAVVADFDDAGGWSTYLSHPDHQNVVAYLDSMVADRARVQFDLPG